MGRPRRSAGEIGVFPGLNGLAGILLLASTRLRETPKTPKFWQNSGGYPVFLRELVFCLHYPLLLAVVAGTLAGSLLAFRYTGPAGMASMVEVALATAKPLQSAKI